MGGVTDRWAARDGHPTHLPPDPSLHQETTGTQRVKHSNEKKELTLDLLCRYHFCLKFTLILKDESFIVYIYSL